MAVNTDQSRTEDLRVKDNADAGIEFVGPRCRTGRAQ
jgi:hypothetical protein